MIFAIIRDFWYYINFFETDYYTKLHSQLQLIFILNSPLSVLVLLYPCLFSVKHLAAKYQLHEIFR